MAPQSTATMNLGWRAISISGRPFFAASAALGAGTLTLSALLKNADVFITDRTLEQLAALGVTGIDAEPYAANPKLVRVCISPWGDRGPLKNAKGSELAAQAMAGYSEWKMMLDGKGPKK